MFDKLIESDTTGAEFKNRSRYFMVSSVVVGLLFLTAIVYSLYAGEIGLGDARFDIAELVSPLVETNPTDPEQIQSNLARSERSEPAVRTSNTARTDEFQFVPDRPSSVPSSIPSRLVGKYILFPGGTNSGGLGDPASSLVGRPEGTGSASLVDHSSEVELSENVPPPPAVRKSPSIMRTSRVLNGEAISLPKPTYPQPAVVLNLQGSVKVQVTIDESGAVISAKAVDGHPFFRAVSEHAARRARFRPTLLNDEPVKVTGVIVYNFKRN